MVMVRDPLTKYEYYFFVNPFLNLPRGKDKENVVDMIVPPQIWAI